MASRFSIETIFSAIDKFTAPLSKMTRSTKTFTKTLKTDFASAQRTVAKWGDSIKRYAWVGVAAMGAALGMAAKQGIELASNLLEVQNVVDVTFGKDTGAKVINEWSKSAITAYGLSELQAKKFTGTMGAMLKSSGLTGAGITKISTDLVGLSADFASFYNLDSEEAFTKIRSGISGETEPLKQLGINMSVANLQAFALTQGITKQFQKMTQSEQVMLRYNYLMKVSKDAQGDFSNTLSTSLANQERVLKTKFSQKLAEAFQKLIPHLTKLADGFSKWLDTIDTGKIADFIVAVFEGFMNIIKAGVFLFKILKPFAPLIFSIIGAFIAYKIVMLAAAIAQGVLNAVMLLNPISLIIVAIGALIGIIIWLIANWNKVTAAIKIVWDWLGKIVKIVWDGIVGAFQAAGKWIGGIWDGFMEKMQPIIAIFQFLIELVGIGLKAAFDGVWNFIKPIIEGIGDFFSGVFDFFGKLGKGVADFVTGGGDATKNSALNKSKKEKSAATVQPPISPTERAFTSYSKEEKTTTNKGEVTIIDKTGKATVTKKPATGPYTLNLQTSGGFTK